MTNVVALRAALAADPQLAAHIHQIKVSARRKSVGWSIKPGDAGLTLHVPDSAPLAAIVRITMENRHRIAKFLLNNQQKAPTGPAGKQLVAGTGFLWLGRNTRLRIVDHATVPLHQVLDGHGTWMELARPAIRYGARPFVDWYSREGAAWARREAPHLWSLLTASKPMPHITVGDIGRTRWGVYHGGSKHLVRIAWQTFQLPPKLVRHVLAHELAHATRPGGKPHGPQFWARFQAAVPGARQEQRELHEVGRNVWKGDVTP